jgi:hypothetical protein
MEPVGSMTRVGSWVRLGFALWCLLLGAGGSVRGATLTVAQDGTGDFTSVVDALVAALDGDSVLVKAGIYDEDGDSHDIFANDLVLTGASESPEATTIRDFQVRFYLTENVVVTNLRFYATETSVGFGGTGMALRHCVVEDAVVPGSGIVTAGLGDLLVEDCAFIGNRKQWYDASTIHSTSSTTIRRCFFYDNDCRAVSVTKPSLIEDCVFVKNRAWTGAAIQTGGYPVTINRCTLWGNQVSAGGAALNNSGPETEVTHTVIAKTEGGFGVGCENVTDFVCCDVWGNDLGDWAGGIWCANIVYRGNFSEDPLFGDPLEADFGLTEGSPCLPGMHGGAECGQIGAYGLGCDVSALIPLTWGRLKSLYGR